MGRVGSAAKASMARALALPDRANSMPLAPCGASDWLPSLMEKDMYRFVAVSALFDPAGARASTGPVGPRPDGPVLEEGAAGATPVALAASVWA